MTWALVPPNPNELTPIVKRPGGCSVYSATTQGLSSCNAVNSPQQRLLRRLVRHRQPFGAAIRIDPRTDEDGVYRIVLCNCLRERLQNDDRSTFRANITVAPRIEGAASAGWRQHAGL